MFALDVLVDEEAYVSRTARSQRPYLFALRRAGARREEADSMPEIGKNAFLEVLRTVPMGVIRGSAEDEGLLPTPDVPVCQN